MTPLQWKIPEEENNRQMKQQMEWEIQRVNWLMQQMKDEIVFFYNE